MKKSFKTRVLSLGLSIVMALSLAAVSGVNTTSAAKKPTMVTEDGGSAREIVLCQDQTRRIKADSWTKKNFKIASAKSNSKNVVVKKNKAGTEVILTGKISDSEDHNIQVTVTFKNKKTGKTCPKKYVSKIFFYGLPCMLTCINSNADVAEITVGETFVLQSNAMTRLGYELTNVETDSEAITARAAKDKYRDRDIVEIVGVKPTPEDKPVTLEVTFRYKSTGEICKQKFVCKVTVR